MTKQLPELEQIEVTGMSRSSFLVRSALATSAVYGAGALTPFMQSAFAQDDQGDLGIANFALTLEYLEAAFYTQAVKKVNLSSDVKALATELRDNEDAHVDALTKMISDAGGTPVDAPKVAFGKAFKSEKAFLKLALTFENTGVAAYNGAGPMLQSKDILGAAGSIVQVEARHAALIAVAAGNFDAVAPDAFDPTMTSEEVLAAVKPFIKS